jgi:hypothetical protein
LVIYWFQWLQLFLIKDFIVTDAKGVGENFWKEFRKLFPNDYNHYCHDTSFLTMGYGFMIFGIWILFF